MNRVFPLNREGYLLRVAEPDHYAFAMRCMEESVLVSVSDEEADERERWMDDFQSLVSMTFDGAGMPNQLFILECMCQPVGILWMGLGKDQFTCRDTGYLLGIFILKEYRGQGLGAELLDFAEQWCREKKQGALTLNVSMSNRWARQLYEDWGFQVHSMVMRRRIR